jgi:hypothetical protein
MKFISKDEYWTEFEKLASNASSAEVAVAYFSPDEEMTDLLSKIPQLKLVISDEFNINNPLKLKRLEECDNTVGIKSFNPENGKLHSKVFIFKNQKGIINCIIGSANLTIPGLKNNNEAGIVINSKQNLHDINNIKRWFWDIYNKSNKIDYEKATRIFNKSSRPSTKNKRYHPRIHHFWLLKTTSAGSLYRDHWNDFLSDGEEGVIAIGWNVDMDNSEFKEKGVDYLLTQISREHPDSQRAEKKVEKFIEQIEEGDYIAIIRGYNVQQTSPVHLYGLAKVKDGRFVYDSNSTWWNHKKEAKIQNIHARIPVEKMREILDMQTCLEAIHGPLNMNKYNKLIDALHEMGFEINL